MQASPFGFRCAVIRFVLWLPLGLPLLVFLLLGVLSARAEDGVIFWFKDLEQASEAAQKTNQPMLLDFWASWCAPCKVLDAEVYTDAGLVVAVGRRVVAVRINFDRQQELARKYSVNGLPHLVFTNSYGTELLHHAGFLNAKELTAVVEALPADLSEINRLDRILQEDKNNLAALQSMGKQLRAAGLYRSSNKYYERAVKNSAAKKNPGQRESLLTEMGFNFLELRDSKQAVKIFERCLKEFPGSENQPQFLLGLVQAFGIETNKEKARNYLKVLQEKYRNAAATQKAEELFRAM